MSNEDMTFDLPEYFFIPIDKKSGKEILTGKTADEPLLPAFFEEESAVQGVPFPPDKTSTKKLRPHEVINLARELDCVGLAIHSPEWEEARMYSIKEDN